MKSRRKRHGNTIAEFPAFIYFLFVGVALPCMAYATIFFRGLYFLYSVRDAVNQAAKCSSFTANDNTVTPPKISAQNTAAAVFKSDTAAWNGLSGTLSIAIITKPLSTTAAGPPSLTKLGTVNTNANMYLIRGTGTGSIQPLFGGGRWIGLVIPGMNGPYPLTVVVDSYVENPQGLTN